MPNYVSNLVEFSGDPVAVQNILIAIKDDRYGLGTVDFNKLIPMPESLSIEAGSRTDKGLKAYRDFISVYTLENGITGLDLLHIPQQNEDAFLRIRTDIQPDEWSLGRQAFQNRLQYGAPTWYEWCISCFGLKFRNLHVSSLGSIHYRQDPFCWNFPVAFFRKAW